MKPLGYFIYNGILVPLLYGGIYIISLFHPKLRKIIKVRKGLLTILNHDLSKFARDDPRIWIHNSSMGEYEQAKPLIRRIKERIPQVQIIVSFFSPSGLEHVEDKGEADLLCYLPFDTPKKARQFISLVKPKVAIMVRHDIWPNHIYELKRQGIPSILINCALPYHIRRTSKFRILNRFLYHPFHSILTVSQRSKSYVLEHRFTEGFVESVGDTRYDQVVHRAEEAEAIVAPLRKWKGNRKGFVAGSTWPSDETVIFQALAPLFREQQNLWVVIVPHEPTEEAVKVIKDLCVQKGLTSIRFSQIESNRIKKPDILIVDRVGILASLYALGEVSFVGGGFGPGVHNVLEPAALGTVVLFGPRNQNSQEADQLVRKGVGVIVQNAQELYQQLRTFFIESSNAIELGSRATQLVQENVGATDRIIDHLEDVLS
jgi:3-deoxy-D-manno-octulosonic-acid transferase